MRRILRALAMMLLLTSSGVRAENPAEWNPGEWMDFVNQAVQCIVDYGLERGAAGTAMGAMPVADIYSALEALPPATKEGLRRLLEARMIERADENTPEDLAKLDLYQAYYTSLVTGDRSRLREIQARHQQALDALAQSEHHGGGISFEPGIDRPGGDFRNFDLGAADAQICQNACINEPSCRAWTYVAPNTIQGPRPRCWLKSTVPAPEAKACCTSGLVPSSAPLNPDGTFEPGVDRPGQDYRFFDMGVADAGSCQTVCRNEPACRAWTYVAPNTIQGPRPRCWLKSGVPEPKAAGCCTSGVIRP